ncbi:hypothetical protein FRC12_015997 [Ceratobasidium sp. 428]|nr:hypothetical protein FRC12_015997 [Ceratobasidium sp. 428]
MPRQQRPIKQCSDEDAAEYETQATEGGEDDLFGLNGFESRWVSHHDYLLERGYQLRPRFRPGWVRSWKGTHLYPEDCEDSWAAVSKLTLDAVRISDGRQVMIKKLIPSAEKPEHDVQKELRMVQHLSAPTLRDDPRNHAMEYLDSFPIPNIPGGVFMVTALYASWNRPEFETIDQAIDCIRQILEGLAFLHENRIAHRDCTPPNIMMDLRPLVDEPFHPIRNACSLDGKYFIERRSRSEAPVRYFYIDFDLSTWFESEETEKAVLGKHGRVQAPELSDTIPYDPFMVDIFVIGTFLEQEFFKKYRGFGFLGPVIRQMKRDHPRRRPNAAQVERSFLKLTANISPRTRRWPLTPRRSGLTTAIAFSVKTFLNQFIFVFEKIFRFITSNT